MSPRNVDAIAGIAWVVNGIKLWWRDLRGLGALGLMLGFVGIVPNLAAALAPPLAFLAQMLSLLVSVAVIVALFYGAREVEAGRSATPAHLLRSLQPGPKTARMVAGVLLPQLAMLVLCGMLLVWIVGVEEMEKLVKLMQDMQAGKPMPPPQALADLAIAQFMLWLAAAVAVILIVGLLTFTLLPDMLFGDVGLFRALQRSVGACLANLPAMAMFAIGITLLGASLLAFLSPIGFMMMPIFGQFGAGVLLNMLFVGVLTPIATNALYLGWKQLLGPQSGNGETATPPPPSDRVAM